MSRPAGSIPAFSAFGIELEYMIVDSERLSILPIADRLLQDVDGTIRCEVERGILGWSNEMVLHLIEVKNRQPSASLAELAGPFQLELRHINRILELYGAQLMPGAMHPRMNPQVETRLWPHQHAEIYQAYARIFATNTHGWANLQSMHINLPFADDQEFFRLHAAIRLVLPILPALAASSPVAEGRNTGFADYRMEVYRTNAESIPQIAGDIIPEPVSSRAEYEERILAPMYRAIAPYEAGRMLQHEWLNSRGAIARFDRNAIEIRVVDVQECPQADLAIAAATAALLRRIYNGDAKVSEEIPTRSLVAIFQECIRSADQAVIADTDYLAALGFPVAPCSAGELWRRIIDALQDDLAEWAEPLGVMLQHGPLARRLLQAINGDYSENRLQAVYRQLCKCLQHGQMFVSS